jgi:hypothetical protein
MTAAELIAARARLNLTAADLGRALELGGRDPGRNVWTWETERHPIPGPVSVAVRLMLKFSALEAAQPTPATQVAADRLEASPEPPQAARTRRRG